MNYRPMKKIFAGEIRKYIKENYVNDIGDYHLNKITELLEDRYAIYDDEYRQRIKQNPAWRITFLFFVLYLLLLYLFCPFKWCINGHFGYKYESKCVVLLRAWATRLNINA